MGIRLTVAMASMVLVIAGCDRGPTYQGKTAAAWAELSSDRDTKTRAEAVKALDAIGTPDVLPALRDRLDDEDYLIRPTAAAALLRHDPQSVSLVIAKAAEWLSHPDKRIATAGVQTLGILGPRSASALPALKRMLQTEESPYLKRDVSAAIEKIEGTK